MISRESPEDYQERADRRKTDMQIAHDPGRHFAPKHISRQNEPDESDDCEQAD
jgi:hypothetical protein